MSDVYEFEEEEEDFFYDPDEAGDVAATSKARLAEIMQDVRDDRANDASMDSDFMCYDDGDDADDAGGGDAEWGKKTPRKKDEETTRDMLNKLYNMGNRSLYFAAMYNSVLKAMLVNGDCFIGKESGGHNRESTKEFFNEHNTDDQYVEIHVANANKNDTDIKIDAKSDDTIISNTKINDGKERNADDNVDKEIGAEVKDNKDNNITIIDGTVRVKEINDDKERDSKNVAHCNDAKVNDTKDNGDKERYNDAEDDTESHDDTKNDTGSNDAKVNGTKVNDDTERDDDVADDTDNDGGVHCCFPICRLLFRDKKSKKKHHTCSTKRTPQTCEANKHRGRFARILRVLGLRKDD